MLAAVILTIICSTAEMIEIRLLDGDDRCSGIPEVLHEGEWWRTFSEFILYRDASFFCRQLNCGDAISVSLKRDSRGRNEKEIFLFCDDHNSTISRNYLQSSVGPDFLNFSAVLVCSDSVRLADGYGLCSGRVEVMSHQSWTVFCENDLDWQDAEVVCREMDCGTPLSLHLEVYGHRLLPYETKEFQCKGTEKRLLTCSTSAREKHTCRSGQAVGVTCSGPDDVKLVDGSGRCAGTVKMFHSGEWRGVGSDDWSMRHAAVVCRQLNCGSAVAATKTVFVSGETGWGVHIGCEGSESVVRQCSIMNKFQMRVYGRVMCSGLLMKPTISFFTPIRVSSVAQKAEVFRGHSFTINCSIQPQYRGGSFYLKLPWTRSNEQATNNHSASFFFRAADDSHHGRYSCVYENKDVYQFENDIPLGAGSLIPTFSSESEPLSIIVTDSPLPAAITRMLLVPLLLLIICLTIFLISKKWGHFIIDTIAGNKRAASVQLENIQLNPLQPNAKER